MINDFKVFEHYKKAHYKKVNVILNRRKKEKYYINKKTHLATEKIFVLHHSLKIINGLWKHSG